MTAKAMLFLSSGILSPKQRSAVVRAVKASPLSGPTEVLLNPKNLSPGKRVEHDVCSTCAVGPTSAGRLC